MSTQMAKLYCVLFASPHSVTRVFGISKKGGVNVIPIFDDFLVITLYHFLG